MKTLVLHPGEMGVSVGAALVTAGHEVRWVSDGRSANTRERAAANKFVDCGSLKAGLGFADLVISVCPPGEALAQARLVQAEGYAGAYLDANAIAPATTVAISELFSNRFVDGGIIGPPAWSPGTTRLYLSGPGAAQVAAYFDGSLLAAKVCGDVIGAASALKMSYAGYTKGNSALLLAIRALASSYGVDDSLLAEWQISQPDLPARSDKIARGTSRKAWRFEGEMREIASSFEAVGLPAQFHEGAANLYHLMATLKDEPAASLDQVIAEILNNSSDKT